MAQLDAIYNVCEWHMVDPERQFRKYLQWDGEAAWVRFVRSLWTCGLPTDPSSPPAAPGPDR